MPKEILYVSLDRREVPNYFKKYGILSITVKLPKVQSTQKQTTFDCELCEKKLSNKYTFKEHMNTHIGEKIFTCQTCSKTFRTKTMLIVHIRIHGRKLFKCEKCAKVFNNKFCLKRHTRTHSDLRPYKCNVCSKRVKTSAILSHHMRMHSETKIFIECSVCDKKLPKGISTVTCNYTLVRNTSSVKIVEKRLSGGVNCYNT